MLELKNVTKCYDNDKGVFDVTLSFPETGLFGLIGPSGCGKSTLLRLISGLVYKTSGSIRYNGIEVDEKSSAFFRKREFASVFQSSILVRELTVFENVQICLDIFDKKITKNDADLMKWADFLKVTSLLDRKVENLSGGEKQRIGILIALLKNSKVILLDEPTASVHLKMGDEIFKMIKVLSKDRLIIVCSHKVEYIYKYCDKIIKMEKGHVVEHNLDACEQKNEELIKNRVKLKSYFYQMIKMPNQMIRRLLFVLINAVVCAILSCCLVYSTKNTESIYRDDIVENKITDVYASMNILDESLYLDSSYAYIDYSLRYSYFDGYESPSSGPYAKAELNSLVLLDNTLNDKEIVISDYAASVLASRKVLSEVKDGASLSYRGVPLIIKSIYDTNYEEYIFDIREMDNREEKTKLFNEQYGKYFSYCYMNAYTLSSLLALTKIDVSQIYVGDSQCLGIDYSLQSGEAKISTNLYTSLGLADDNILEMYSYKKTSLKFSFNVSDSYDNKILISQDDAVKIIGQTYSFLNDVDDFGIYYFNANARFKDIYAKTLSNNSQIKFYNYIDTQQLYMRYKSFNNVFLILFICTVMILLVESLLFLYFMVKSTQPFMKTQIMYGYSKKDNFIQILLEKFSLLLIAFVISIVIYFPITSFINDIISSENDLISFSIGSQAIILTAELLLNLIIVGLYYLVRKRKDIIVLK